MIEEFIYYWKNYNFKTAWDVLLHGDLIYEFMEDLEVEIDESPVRVITFKFD